MAYCTSCGSPIPDGQGNSCSMCYGDIDHGRDGYYRQWAEEQIEREAQTRQFEEQMQQEYERQMDKQQHEEIVNEF